MHFGPVTEIDQQTWKRLSIGRAGPKEDAEEVISHSREIQTYPVPPALAAMSSLQEDHRLNPQNDCRYFFAITCAHYMCMGITAAFKEFAEAH